MDFFILIILPILFMLLLFFGTRNLMEYVYEAGAYTPLKFNLYVYIVMIVLLFIPIVNAAAFLSICIHILAKISEGEQGSHSGWKVRAGKRNWIYSMYKFFTKKI